MAWIVTILLLLMIYFVFLIKENKKIGITKYNIKDKRIHSHLTVAHLSDIHNDTFGNENQNLFDKVSSIHPDIIVITGDFLDKRRTNIDRGIRCAEQLVKIAPVYMVTGNHEAKIKNWAEYKKLLSQTGIKILEGTSVNLNDGITLLGINDVRFASHHDKKLQKEYLNHFLSTYPLNKDKYNILLSHQPQFWDIYSQYDVDLVLSGHAHGGQIRLPLIGGLFSPNQGILPRYTEGMKEKNNSKMIISRGLGNSLFPLRVNNNPQIIQLNFDTEE